MTAAKPKVPAFKSGFAILDVTTGRKALAKHLAEFGAVRVTLDVIVRAIGNDDGVSIEFSGDVQSVKNVRAV